MKFIVNVFLALCLTFSAAFIIDGGQRYARAETSAQNALMTIKFNQKVVSYQNQLFFVVREAVRTKPNVIFDVVATTPSGTSQYGQQVANDIARIGVSPSQITFRAESGMVSNEEVKIFVR